MERKYLVGIIVGVLVLSGIIVAGWQYRRANFPKPTGLETAPTQTETKTQEPGQTGGQTITNTQAPTQPISQEIILEVTQPANGATVTSPNLTVKGKTAPRADVFVNDEELKANASGNFSTVITLDEGENTIVIAANDSEGNSTEKELIVTYNISQ